MLLKYPGLTAISVVALSVAIGGGVAYLEFVNDFVRPTLDVRDGDRVVGIVNWDTVTGNPEHRSLRDFLAWRDTLESVEELGAYARLERNLITDDRRTEPVSGVEISASAFRLSRLHARSDGARMRCAGASRVPRSAYRRSSR